MSEFFQKSGRVCSEGTELLRWRVSLPLSGERIAAFYEEIGKGAAEYCEEKLADFCRQTFDAMEDPNKRFCFSAFSYRLEGRVTYEDEEFLSVCLVAELRRRGDRSFLQHFEDGQIWEKKTELRLPPEEAVQVFAKTSLSRKEKRSAKGALLSDNSVLWYDGGAWQKKDFFVESNRNHME